MPAYTRPDKGLVITFWREEQEQDRRVAPDGAYAVALVMRTLAGMDELQAGDKVIVNEAADDRPAVSRAGHYS
jgi:hypothetical protein